MSQLLDPNDPTGIVKPQYDVNKIVDYKLEDAVLEMHSQGFKYPTIARKCNELLQARTEDKQYVPVNHMNIKYYLQSKQKEIDLAKEGEVTALTKKTIDVNTKLENIITIIETELDKLRNPDNPVLDAKQEFFIRLIKEFNRTLELANSVQGRGAPSITFNIFQTNVERFCRKIQECAQLTDESKAITLTLAADELITENLLKPVEGKEIKK